MEPMMQFFAYAHLPFVSGVEDIECQWELDPDILREDQDERRRIEAKDSEP